MSNTLKRSLAIFILSIILAFALYADTGFKASLKEFAILYALNMTLLFAIGWCAKTLVEWAIEGGK